MDRSSMDQSDFPMSKSPRREIQGPRPTPLKIRKESHKIKKPSLAPPPQPQHPPQNHPQAPPHAPVIIYTVSPKVIHTNATEFMTLVQRLTGLPSSSSSSTLSSSAAAAAASSSTIQPGTMETSFGALHDNNTRDGGVISPAARYATIEKAKSSSEGKKHQLINQINNDLGFVEDIERSGLFPVILSPGPASLPPISPSFFPPPLDPNSVPFHHDLSSVLQSTSPSIVSPQITSPSSVDLFNNILFDQ